MSAKRASIAQLMMVIALYEQQRQTRAEIDGGPSFTVEGELEQVIWSSPKRKKIGVKSTRKGVGRLKSGRDRHRHIRDAVDTGRMSGRFASGGVAVPGER
jgi:hypothetical protein